MTSIRLQIGLNADPERVFKALTDSNAVRAWFSELSEIDLSKNQYDFWGRFTPHAPDREGGKHTILEQIPGERLTYRWRAGGHDTRVMFQLHPHDKGTLLSLRQVPENSEADPDLGVAEDFWFLSLENLRRYLDGKASDGQIDFTNPMRGDIRHEVEIDAPAQRVWKVLTDPEELNRWIATAAKLELEKDGLYSLGWIQDGVDFSAAKIIEVVSNEKLSIEDPPGMFPYPTVTTWEMKENNGKTWLIFTQSGFDADQDVGGIHTGWRNFVNWVRSVSEYGAAWQPPIAALAPGTIAYPAAILSAQDQVVEELREAA